jgi:glutathione S-transferase
MKLTFAPTSPYARKVRVAAIELGLIDKIEFVPASVSPGKPNEEYSRDISPLRKLPALILDDGSTIVDSYVIVEYLDELAGNKLIPTSGPAKWRAKTEHAITQGMLESMLLCRYERMLRPEDKRWDTWIDDQWDRAWQGFKLFESRADTLSRPLDIVQISLACTLGYADFRFADCGWRKAYPKLAAFHETMMKRPSIRDTVPPPA